MQTETRSVSSLVCALIALLFINASAKTPVVKTVEIKSPQTSYEVGQHVKFTVTAKDDMGRLVNEKPANWFAAPFDLAAIDAEGNASFYQPGEVVIGVFVGGKPHFEKI